MFKILLLLLLALPYSTAHSQQNGQVDFPNEGDIQKGRVAYISPHEGTLYEVNLKGAVTWSFKLPASLHHALSAGADVEWIRETDTFLYIVPRTGVYEVSRAGKIVWSHETKTVSHDADRLPNGNTLFAYGWGGDNDPSFTEVDRNGEVVQSWRPGDALSKSTELWVPSPGEDYSYTHANAVQRLGDGSTLVSLRNFNQFVIVKEGKIQKSFKIKPRVHDPVLLPDGTLYYAILADQNFHDTLAGRVPIPYGNGHFLMKMEPDGTEKVVFRAGSLLRPLHTVQPLSNGNILVTGSTTVAQISPDGKMVWQLTLHGFKQKSEDRRRWLYKAAWVDIQD